MYLARIPDYDGEWILPFAGRPDAQIAIGIWGSDVTDDEQAENWARQRLADSAVITAIILERGEIRAAWETVNGSLQLVARGPQS